MVKKKSYLHKDISIYDQWMIVQICAWRKHQQVWNHVIFCYLFNINYNIVQEEDIKKYINIEKLL